VFSRYVKKKVPPLGGKKGGGGKNSPSVTMVDGLGEGRRGNEELTGQFHAKAKKRGRKFYESPTREGGVVLYLGKKKEEDFSYFINSDVWGK